MPQPQENQKNTSAIADKSEESWLFDLRLDVDSILDRCKEWISLKVFLFDRGIREGLNKGSLCFKSRQEKRENNSEHP